MNTFYEEPVLTRVASCLAVAAPSWVYTGALAKGTPPSRYRYEQALVTAIAGRECHSGWILFAVKYLGDSNSYAPFYELVKKDLPETEHRDQLANLVCEGFCSAKNISCRLLRRELGIDRPLSNHYFRRMERTLYWLRATEHEFAELVRKNL